MKRTGLGLVRVLVLSGALVLLRPDGAAWAQPTPVDVEEASLEALLDVRVSAAARYEQTAQDAAAAVTVISADEIASHGYRTLAEVLDQVRGFYTTNDLNYTYVGVRGFSRPGSYNNRVLILLNGHTLNESSSGIGYIDARLGVDLSLVERIEVIRGPGSALYGTSAMFAVINIVTKEAHDLEGIEGTAEAGSRGYRSGRVTLGRSFDRSRPHDDGVVLSAFWGDVGGQDLYFETFDDQAGNDGIAERRDWRRHYGLAGHLAHGALTVQGMLTELETGLPAVKQGMVFNSARATQDHTGGFAEVAYETEVALARKLQVRGYFDRAGYRAAYPHHYGPAGEVLLAHRVLSSTLGADVQYQWDTSVANRLVVGVEYKHARGSQRLRDEAGGALLDIDDRSGLDLLSVYVQDEYRLLADLALVAGLRHDRYYAFDGAAGAATSPRVALIYNPTRGSALKLLYGEAFRAPGLVERYFVHPGQVRNLELQTEKIRTGELVWEQQLARRFSGAVSLYRYRTYDLIDLAPLATLDSRMHGLGRAQGRTT